MPLRSQSSLDVKEGLVQIIGAERFRRKPRSGSNAHVIVMEEVAGSERHYATLRNPSDRLSIGEQLWGRYVCYVVDRAERILHFEERLATEDPLTEVRATMDVSYRAVDGERVVLKVGDALSALKNDLTSALRAELRLLSAGAVNERELEQKILVSGASHRAEWGLEVTRARVSVGWTEEAIRRAREFKIEDEDRARQKKEEIEDLQHMERLLSEVGLANSWPDFKIQLAAMPRKEAWLKVLEKIETGREMQGRYIVEERRQHHDLIKHLIDRGILEEMDLVRFGKDLLSQYSGSSAASLALGSSSPMALFGPRTEPSESSETPAGELGPKTEEPESSEGDSEDG